MTVIPLFQQQQCPAEPPITRKAGHTLLEFMQEAKGMPHHAPTVQVRTVRGGLYQPVNPLAALFGRLIGRQVLTEAQLQVIEEMGMAVERAQ
jgi:hypothetical protein